MENINSQINTITPALINTLPTTVQPVVAKTSNTYFYIKVIVIILILAILGFNIFTNLGYITDQVAILIKPITEFFLNLFGQTSKNIIKTSAKGTKKLAGAVDKAVDDLDAVVSSVPDSKDKPLSNNVGQDYEKKLYDTDPDPDKSNSDVQQGKVGKKGYCYVGNWNGHRSCVKVSESNKCLSGEIFDREDICRNPELRT